MSSVTTDIQQKRARKGPFYSHIIIDAILSKPLTMTSDKRKAEPNIEANAVIFHLLPKEKWSNKTCAMSSFNRR